MNYKNYFKQRLFEQLALSEAEFQGMEDGIPVFTPSNPSSKPTSPTNTNPVGPAPANPDRKPELPPGTPPQPPAPRDPNGNRLPGAFGLVPIRMPDGSIRYEWVWVLPGGGGILMWHPNGYWVKPARNPLAPGTGTIA